MMVTRTWMRGMALLMMVALVCSAEAQPLRKAARMDHGIASGAGASRRAASLPDTVRILAVMVEFQADAETRTSGTGKFNTVYPYDLGGEVIDPYPHDRSYFQAHLRFLENYIRKSSGGKTQARGTVLDSIVTVSNPIRSYTFLKNAAEKPVADLAVEAWTLADKKFPGVDFSQYDMFVVFHAGRGRDVDLASLQGSDPTPYDIPSLSFTLNGFRKQYGAAFEGIAVDGGAFRITNSSVIPCTDTREIPMITGQTGLFELSINGLLAASFGTYAGLPDLFNTKRGITGIGRFGLMDAESIFAFGGVCPPAPSAWEKQFLGWTQPREASPGRKNYLLTAYRTDQPSTADIISVPITGSEYWLVENRQRDPGNNGQRVTMVSGGKDMELSFPKDTTGFSTDDISTLKGVVVDVEDVDWSLPGGTIVSDDKQARVGGGILIWHIDESVIAAGLADNTVNADPDKRGVDLEQAGGPQDIGETVSSLFGTSIATGSPLDYWSGENISPLYKNSFGALTTPNTRANSGAYTHVTLDNFSSSDPVMDLDIAIGDNTIAPVAGYPVDLREWLQPGQTQLLVQSAPVGSSAAHALFVLAGTAPGVAAAAGSDTARLFVLMQDGSMYGGTAPAALLPGMRHVLGAPMISRMNADTHLQYVVVKGWNGADRVQIAIFTIDTAARRLDLIRSIGIPRAQVRALDASWAMLTEGLVGPRTELVYLTASPVGDTLHALLDGEKDIALGGPGYSLASDRGGLASSPVVWVEGIGGVHLPSGTVTPWTKLPDSPSRSSKNAVMAVYQENDVDVFTMTQYRGVLSTYLGGGGSGKLFASRDVATRASRPQLASADVDGDGRNDVLIADSTQVASYNMALASVDYHPAQYGARTLLAARFPGQKSDAIFAAGDGMLSQLHTGAKQAEGFPVPVPLDASVVLLPYSAATPVLGIAAAGSDGHVYLYNTGNAIDGNWSVWRSEYGDEYNRNMGPKSNYTRASGDSFFPLDRCYNWPNPTYEKTTKIRYFVSQDAEISVKIYDLSGASVDALTASATGGLDNEIEWNVASIQTGVYMAHVKATAASGVSGEKIIKIAVVK